MIKNLLETHIRNNVPDESVALLLSGGVDSITAGLSAHNVGKQVHAYSFFLDGYVSYDFLRATEVAHKMGWKFTPVVVPKTNLVKDWYKLVELHCRKRGSHLPTCQSEKDLYFHPRSYESDEEGHLMRAKCLFFEIMICILNY